MNDAALAASKAIAALNDETYEYSCIIWSLNGQVGWTTPYTDHSAKEVNWLGGLSQVPTGAIIVGIVHNHPDKDTVDDGLPSGGLNEGSDWRAYNQLDGTSLSRGITVDSNLLLYIYSNEDHETHVYDKTDKTQQNYSCSLQ